MRTKLLMGFIALFVFASTAFSTTEAHAQALTFTRSNNWSGYAANGENFTKINGSWTVPSVSATYNTTADATWIGIGGVSGTDLIQTGTEAIVQNGQVSYQAWYETLPNDSIIVPLSVTAGNSVSASLAETSPNLWQITLINNSTGQSYSTTVNYASTKSSAEWIEEMPSTGATYIPLDNFNTINFFNLSAVENGTYGVPRDFSASAISMLSSGYTMATPSALGNDGASFSVSRTNTSVESVGTSPQTYVTIPRVGRGWRRTGQREGSAPVQTQTITQSVTPTVSYVYYSRGSRRMRYFFTPGYSVQTSPGTYVYTYTFSYRF